MEKINVENIAKKMFHLVGQEYKIISYGTTIYELYEQLSVDSMLDLIGLLRSTNKIILNPGELSKQAFSQIYLIFDYEPHYQKYSDDIIKQMLEFFDNETDNGKLYINYPMFESAFYIDDFNKPVLSFEKINIDDCIGNNFKKKVREISCFGKKNHLDFTLSKTLDIWQCIKWNYIKAIKLINKKEIDYLMILDQQIKSKNSNNEILVLSTFILMIIDYNPEILNVINKKYGLFELI